MLEELYYLNTERIRSSKVVTNHLLWALAAELPATLQLCDYEHWKPHSTENISVSCATQMGAFLAATSSRLEVRLKSFAYCKQPVP